MWKLKCDTDTKVELATKQCLPPCQIRCPINEDIQRTNVLISLLPSDYEQAKQGIIQIGDYLYERNPLFTICGYICGLCEQECNYKDKGGSIKRRLLKRFIADTYTAYLSEKKPLNIKRNNEKVAIFGGGPGGLFCAWELAKKGYNVTIFATGPKLGGALRYIPTYRLPEEVLDSAVDNLVRIGGIEVKTNVKIEDENEEFFVHLKEEGYKAFFIVTGTSAPRPLTFGTEKVEGQDMEGVIYGLELLGEVNKGHSPSDYFKDKKVIVIGGGNVAFDAARTAVRLGGNTTLVCLECKDKNSKDGIPADIEEIEVAMEEGIKIVYSRGVNKIIGENGKFKKINCPKCVSVFDEKGMFNPQFNVSDNIELKGDILLITIGQMPDRTFLQKAGVLDEKGRLGVDTVTLQSLIKEDVFIGGDLKKIGFAADAMRAGIEAAESIDRYIRGFDLKKARLINYEASDTPIRKTYKHQPEVKWEPVEERIDFNMFEKGFTLESAINEARRCMHCGPCISCKACVAAGIRQLLPSVEVDEIFCSGCAICVSVCNYGAAYLKKVNGKLLSAIDPFKCKACGICVSSCPAIARKLVHDEAQLWKQKDPEVGIVCFSCKFGWGYSTPEINNYIKNCVPVVCIGKVDIIEIIQSLKQGADGVLLLGCAEGDCHHQDGNFEAKKKVYILKKLLEQFGIEKERVEVIAGHDSTGEKIPSLINDMVARLKKLEKIRI